MIAEKVLRFLLTVTLFLIPLSKGHLSLQIGLFYLGFDAMRDRIKFVGVAQ